jgi:hypothetical protein
MTPLDTAHAAMLAHPEHEARRLEFYGALAASELFVLLRGAPEGETADPALVEMEGAVHVLAFDREERLAAFAEGEAPYLALSGRALVEMLTGRGAGIGLNLGVAPSAFLAPPEAVEWMAERLAVRPAEVEARIEELHPPAGLPEALVQALDARLAAMGGRAGAAWLVAARYADGGRGHLLAFSAPSPGAEGALARAVGEALAFSGLEAGALDVAFLPRGAPLEARLERVGLRFDLPELPVAQARGVPGGDPDRPPRLR